MMTQVMVTVLLPFLVPLGVLFLWTWGRTRWVETHGGAVPPVEKGAWFAAVLAGFILMILTLVAVAVLESPGRPGDTYTPPQLVDGRVVPGGFGAK